MALFMAGLLASCGFTKRSTRQIKTWDPRKLETQLKVFHPLDRSLVLCALRRTVTLPSVCRFLLLYHYYILYIYIYINKLDFRTLLLGALLSKLDIFGFNPLLPTPRAPLFPLVSRYGSKCRCSYAVLRCGLQHYVRRRQGRWQRQVLRNAIGWYQPRLPRFYSSHLTT